MKNYNTTDLDPQTTFERHVFHRDQFAHYLRWTHILKEAKVGDRIVDFGCGKGNLLEVLYRNRLRASRYIGLDIRPKTIQAARDKFNMVDWCDFWVADLVADDMDLFLNLEADKVCSFEVLEHVGKQNVDKFLLNFIACGNENATYYLSTPNYDEAVGAAGNHTYDAGDGRGVDIQEFTHQELEHHLGKYFTIINKWGTFASQRDYKPLMNDCQREMFDTLSQYYDSNILSNLMAPMFPAHSRNTMWVMKPK